MDTPGLAVSATMLTASVAKMREARGDLSIVISILPKSALNTDPESYQPVFAEIGKWLRP
jgi:hypothetical protein